MSSKSKSHRGCLACREALDFDTALCGPFCGRPCSVRKTRTRCRSEHFCDESCRGAYYVRLALKEEAMWTISTVSPVARPKGVMSITDELTMRRVTFSTAVRAARQFCDRTGATIMWLRPGSGKRMKYSRIQEQYEGD